METEGSCWEWECWFGRHPSRAPAGELKLVCAVTWSTQVGGDIVCHTTHLPQLPEYSGTLFQHSHINNVSGKYFLARVNLNSFILPRSRLSNGFKTQNGLQQPLEVPEMLVVATYLSGKGRTALGRCMWKSFASPAERSSPSRNWESHQQTGSRFGVVNVNPLSNLSEILPLSSDHHDYVFLSPRFKKFHFNAG